MDSPLARYLTRFSTEPPLELEPEPGIEMAEMPAIDAIEPEVDQAALEHERQLEEMRAAMAADAETRIAVLQAAHAETLATALAEARATWAESEAAPLAACIEQAFDALRLELDERVADALLPLLAAAVVEKARTAVGESLDRLLDDPAHPLVTLHGPSELIDAIRRERPEARGIDYIATDDVDMRVTGAGVRITTHLGSALAALYAQTA